MVIGAKLFKKRICFGNDVYKITEMATQQLLSNTNYLTDSNETLELVFLRLAVHKNDKNFILVTPFDRQAQDFSKDLVFPNVYMPLERSRMNKTGRRKNWKKETSKDEKPLVKFCLVDSKESHFCIELSLVMKVDSFRQSQAQNIMVEVPANHQYHNQYSLFMERRLCCVFGTGDRYWQQLIKLNQALKRKRPG